MKCKMINVIIRNIYSKVISQQEYNVLKNVKIRLFNLLCTKGSVEVPQRWLAQFGEIRLCWNGSSGNLTLKR